MPRSRSRSRSTSPPRELPYSASPISEADYFLKSDEFRTWLKDEKHKYFDEISGDKARSYFRKFVKAWNKGKLSRSLYAGIDPASVSAPSQTAYKWSFASKGSSSDFKAIRAAREEVSSATYKAGPSSESNRDSGGSTSNRVRGPTLPSASDLAYARETQADLIAEERKLKRKRDKADNKDRIEDMVGPKEVGREGALEKKRAKREGDRAFRDSKEDAGLEVDEKTLLGGGDSFREMIARRDAGKQRREGKREEQVATARERNQAFKDKEKKTMDYLQQLAKQRFG